jgi:hypothetical protein
MKTYQVQGGESEKTVDIMKQLPTGVVLLNAKLNREDARKLSLMQDKLTPDPNYEEEF